MRAIDMFRLDKKTAVVTGGSTGLGAQIATALAEAGASVVITARKLDRCIAMCKTLEKKGARAFPIGCDISKNEECENLVDAKLTTIREMRLKKLKDTDYMANSDVTMPDYIKTWRQTLRDLPQNNTTESQYDTLLAKDADGNLTNSVWTQPTE